MAKESAKSIVRDIYVENPQISVGELFDIVGDRVSRTTIQKYLVEFRRQYGNEIVDVPDNISMNRLEKELAKQLEVNPNSTVVKSCIDFLKLKQMANDTSEEIDMEKFLKIGKNINNEE